MKRETLRHPKTYDLASRLGCSRPEALGYLTLLWDHVTEVAPRGDIGKWPDGAIAGACDYRGNAEAFVDALVDAGWLERHDTHRLIVHDWPDHCERWVKAKLQKLRLEFLECYARSVEATVEPTTEEPVEASPPRDRTEPNRTEPNPLPQPPPESPPASSKPHDPWEGVEAELFAAGVTTAPIVVSELQARGSPPELARAAIAHWRQSQPAWGPGALASRLEALRPGQNPTELWPPASKAAEVAKSRERSLKKQAELDALKASAKQMLKQNDSKILELEARYGDYLDSMTEKQVRKFAANCGLDLLLKSYRAKDGVTGLLRESLLLDLETSNFQPEGVSA